VAEQQTWTAEASNLCNRVGDNTIFALMNNEVADPRRKIIVRRVSLYPTAPVGDNTAGLAALAGFRTLDRITAASGGTDVPAVKFRSSAATLPSQVTFLVNPDSVTVSGGTFRRVPDSPSQINQTTVVSFYPFTELAYAGGAAGDCRGGPSEHSMAGLYSTGMDTAMQSWTLAAGEGLALIQQSVGVPFAHGPHLAVKVTATGECYNFSTMENVASGYTNDIAQWALMNNSGSGVTLEVSVIEDIPAGEAYAVGNPSINTEYRLVKIDGVLNPGQEITPMPHSTANAALPSSVKCYKGPIFSVPAGYKDGAAFSIHSDATLGTAGASGASITAQLRIGTIRNAVLNMPLQITASPNLRFGLMAEQVLWDTEALNGEGIEIEAGQGIGICVGGARFSSALNNIVTATSTVVVEFAHVPPPAGGGTFPAVNDVDIGVVYGPTDNLTGTLLQPIANDVRNGVNYGGNGIEFNGDLVLPTTSDVLLGVGYGADGTEFTGTASGGGGTTIAYTPRRSK